MFKSMRSIIILAIVIVITVILSCSIQAYFHSLGDKVSKDVKIYQVDENNLQIVENIVVNVNDDDREHLNFPISIYRGSYDDNIDLFDEKVTVNNIEILDEYENKRLGNNDSFNNVNKDIFYYFGGDTVYISTKDNKYFEAGENVITISYKCNISNAITNYNDVATLKINRNSKYDRLNTTITFLANPSSFNVSSNKAIIKKVSNNTYKVDITNVQELSRMPYVSFTFDNNIFQNAKRVYDNYDNSKEINIFANENEDDEAYFIAIAISAVIIFIATMLITKKIKPKKYYLRDTKTVISPILAESLIDRKMGSKELITTCIVDLICRGNIQNLNNDIFKLVSRDNLSDYEEQIVDMLFSTSSVKSFSALEYMFINDNSRTNFFVKQFKQIKKKILDKLFELDIYSKKWEVVLRFIRSIGILIYLNIGYLLRNAILNETTYFELVFILNVVALIILIAIGRKPIDLNEGPDTNEKSGFLLIWMCALELTFSFKEHYVMFTMLIILIILNTITMFKSRMRVLTKKGKEEYEKVHALKSYIEDFSLMNEKDIDNTIIWDEYLAYAVAFSIPNKITSRFKSELMETNIILQNIDKFITS